MKLKTYGLEGKRLKYLIFADDTIVYVDNQQKKSSKFLELVSEFSKTMGYRITQKTIAFLLTKNS